MTEIDLAAYKDGSACLADEYQIEAAGLFDGNGMGGNGSPNPYFGERPFGIPKSTPTILFSGAGGGKMACVAAFPLALDTATPMLILDPRGEGSSTFQFNCVRTDTAAWNWSPYRILPDLVPSHACNPLDILTLDSPTFHADTQFISASIMPVRGGGGNAHYFETKGQQWTSGLMKSRVERDGHVSFPSLYRTISMIQTDIEAWKEQLTFMLNSRFDDVRRTAAEMLAKQASDSQNEFGGIIGGMYNNLACLDDPKLRDSLENPDFSLDVLTDSERTHRVTMNVPASYLEILAPVIRTFFTTTMLYKERKPDAPRVHLLCDEAGQLQKAPFLQRAFTYGRGAGLTTTALFQSIGQVLAHYGQAGLQDFMSSAGTRQFFCVRDYETAKLVSDMLGTTTLEYDDTLKQEEARRRKRDMYRRFMEEDVDPWEAAEEIRHFDFASHHRSRQPRKLMTPDEVLAMTDDRQLLFISGFNIPPIYAHRYPYWTRPEMAGFYLNNPYHGDPYGPVRIMTRRGPRMADVITCDPPREIRHLPQSAVPFRYVEGFCPI